MIERDAGVYSITIISWHAGAGPGVRDDYYSMHTWGLAAIVSGTMACVQAVEPKVNTYNWYDFIASNTLKDFQAQTGIQSAYDVFDNSEVMQSKLMAGRSGYDVVVATGDLLQNLIKAGVLKELDRSQLPNLLHLDPDILAKVNSNDPGNRFAVPYLWGTIGIGYDVAKVHALLGNDAPLDSWDLIFKEESLAKLGECGVAMLDAPAEIISIALHYLGLPYNSQNLDDYLKAQALLLKLRPISATSIPHASLPIWPTAISVPSSAGRVA